MFIVQGSQLSAGLTSNLTGQMSHFLRAATFPSCTLHQTRDDGSKCAHDGGSHLAQPLRNCSKIMHCWHPGACLPLAWLGPLFDVGWSRQLRPDDLLDGDARLQPGLCGKQLQRAWVRTLTPPAGPSNVRAVY